MAGGVRVDTGAPYASTPLVIQQYDGSGWDQPQYGSAIAFAADDDPFVDLDGTPMVGGVRVDTGAPYASTPPVIQHGGFGTGGFGGVF